MYLNYLLLTTSSFYFNCYLLLFKFILFDIVLLANYHYLITFYELITTSWLYFTCYLQLSDLIHLFIFLSICFYLISFNFQQFYFILLVTWYNLLVFYFLKTYLFFSKEKRLSFYTLYETGQKSYWQTIKLW